MRVPSVEGRRRPLGLRGWLIGAAILLVIFLLSLRGFARFYTDYLWFQDIGFAKTWRALLSAKAVPALIFSTIFFVLMLVNLIIADRVAPRYRGTGPEDEVIERYRSYVAPYAGRVRVGVSLFFAIIMGSGVAQQWQKWVLFANSTSFGTKDPQFHKDISFYVFRLPFLQYAASWTFTALLVVLIVVLVWHYLNGGIRLQSPFQRVTPQVKVHLSVLLALMSLTKTVQYYFQQFSLVWSNRGAVDGATYTDVHAQLPAYRLLIFISIAAAVLFIVNIWRKGWVFPIIAVGLWGFIAIVVGTIYPAVIQRFTVQPNELAREQSYIQRNIAATRDAFNLSGITTKKFSYDGTLTDAERKQSQQTLESVRLYDPDRAEAAFKFQQALSTAYEFNNVDVDRYKVGDETGKPTLAGTRELDQQHLPDNSWTSQHLVYTHGYGVVAAAADDTNSDQPDYILKDIPPTGDIPLDPKFAPVYFGENLTGYSVVDTKVAEQEANSAGTTQQAQPYTGTAGVPVSSFLRKAALALRFGDWNLFVSGQLTSKSRVIYIRDVLERAKTAAPFLTFDHDPYPVVLNKRIVWVLDAYTTTNRYPYSQSMSSTDSNSALQFDFNYIRNSVKATIDAYDGTVKFYVIDPTDPMVKTYRKAFPELFTDASQMPDGLRDHFRYPEDLFSAQTQQYQLYHITDPVQYFNKQDIWDIAGNSDSASTTNATVQPQNGNNGGRNTTLSASNIQSDPLYLRMQLPGESNAEFTLQRSFTPRRKSGILSSFMVARMDGNNYGKLMSYSVSDPQAPSSFKAQGAIESDQFISSQFTLLDQGGSRVEKGDVQLLPVGNTVLYVRPIWITAKSASQEFPRYRFVAAVAGDRAVLGCNTADAVNALIRNTSTQLQNAVNGGRGIADLQCGSAAGTNTNTAPTGPSTTPTTTPGNTTPDTTPTTVPANATVAQLLAQARSQFTQAADALKAGNLASYQQHLESAQSYVNQAYEKLNGATSGTTTTTTKPPG
jgi:uncharacterized membrane protein (UPF0182 family)